ncbi:hypothetical protein Hanom_Chr10g00903941 [Helianthus anomalus]
MSSSSDTDSAGHASDADYIPLDDPAPPVILVSDDEVSDDEWMDIDFQPFALPDPDPADIPPVDDVLAIPHFHDMIIYGHPEGEHVVAFLPIPLDVVGPEGGDDVPPVIDPMLDDDAEDMVIPVVQVEHLHDDLGIGIDFDIVVLEVAHPDATTIDISSSSPATPLTPSPLHSPDTVLPPPSEALPFQDDPVLPTTFLDIHPIIPPVTGPAHYSLSGATMPDEHLPPYPLFGSFATPITSTVSSHFDPYVAGPSHTAPSYPMAGYPSHTSVPLFGDPYHFPTSMHSIVSYPSPYFADLHAYPPPSMSPHDPYYPSHIPSSTDQFRLTSVEIQLGIVFRRLDELSAQQSASRAHASAAPSSSPLPQLPTSSPPPPPPLLTSPPPPSPPAPLFSSHHALPPSIEGRVSALEEDMAYVRGVIDASTPPPPPPL